ncbi:MAG: cobyric acid synthase, partial [Gluconacetobacter diazotrophicus]|nr:cobyric acid synthase [Gluconacetobacter diazotrophicus]
RACGVPPTVHMNPVLLKPQSEIGAQVVVRGRVVGAMRAREYQGFKAGLLPTVLDSFEFLRREADIVLVEGAGSASEVNLRAGDIANMGFAAATGVPVVMVGDIDRGGVIASLVGTHAVLPPADRDRIVAFLVNRMRGDPALFADGMTLIADRTGWLPLGLVPHTDSVRPLPEEDAADPAPAPRLAAGDDAVRVVVPRLPMASNLDDLDPLFAEPGLAVTVAVPGRPLPADCDLVLLPGSKATIADLAVLRAEGWDIDILAHHRRGGRILGLCGGYQMLGRRIDDPDGIEGPPGGVPGLGLLAVDTVLESAKRLANVEAVLVPEEVPVSGYEMHVGRTDGEDRRRPLVRFDDGAVDGAASADGRVAGGYLHGIFDRAPARHALMRRWGAAGATAGHHQLVVDRALDALADHLERHLDVEALLRLSGRAN